MIIITINEEPTNPEDYECNVHISSHISINIQVFQVWKNTSRMNIIPLIRINPQ